MQRLTELIFNEVASRIDTLSPAQAREVVSALQEKYRSNACEDQAKRQGERPVERSAANTKADSGAARSANQLSEPTSLSADLPLGAGAELTFSSLSSSPPLESTMRMTDMAADTRKAAPVAIKTEPHSDVSAIVQTKPIVDNAKEVSAISTPEIAADHSAIEDNAKDVTALKTPTITNAAPPIVDKTPDVRESETPKIVSTDKPMGQRSAAPLEGIAVPAAQLRPAHVVQPAEDADDVIEAELIAIDGDEDAIRFT